MAWHSMQQWSVAPGTELAGHTCGQGWASKPSGLVDVPVTLCTSSCGRASACSPVPTLVQQEHCSVPAAEPPPFHSLVLHLRGLRGKGGRGVSARVLCVEAAFCVPTTTHRQTGRGRCCAPTMFLPRAWPWPLT